MIRQGGGGSIVMISSVHAFRPYANSSAYNGAKAAVNQMAFTWAIEVAPQGIRVNVIEPGWIDTPGERSSASEAAIEEAAGKLLMGRLGRAEEIAKAVVFLASDDASYITGACLRVDGGFVLPYRAEA
jgi:glucose 1-dehydrogenase